MNSAPNFCIEDHSMVISISHIHMRYPNCLVIYLEMSGFLCEYFHNNKFNG